MVLLIIIHLQCQVSARNFSKVLRAHRKLIYQNERLNKEKCAIILLYRILKFDPMSGNFPVFLKTLWTPCFTSTFNYVMLYFVSYYQLFCFSSADSCSILPCSIVAFCPTTVEMFDIRLYCSSYQSFLPSVSEKLLLLSWLLTTFSFCFSIFCRYQET